MQKKKRLGIHGGKSGRVNCEEPYRKTPIPYATPGHFA
jgi:hypothetical protein